MKTYRDYKSSRSSGPFKGMDAHPLLRPHRLDRLGHCSLTAKTRVQIPLGLLTGGFMKEYFNVEYTKKELEFLLDRSFTDYEQGVFTSLVRSYHEWNSPSYNGIDASVEVTRVFFDVIGMDWGELIENRQMR